MKKTYLKFLLGITLVFCFFAVTNACFCATAKSTDRYYFEKPDSWDGSKVYINLIDSSSNTTAFPEPGTEISKILNKFKIENVFEINGDIYKFVMNDEIAATGNFDKIVFSNGNDDTNVTNKTNPVDLSSNVIYKISGGTGLAQDCIDSQAFNITASTNIRMFSDTLKEKNTNLDQDIINNLEKIAVTLQKITARLTNYDLGDDLLIPLNEVNNYLQKEDNLYDELNKKIEEGKNAIKDGGYTKDSTTKLEAQIKNGETVKENYNYYTNDQVKNTIQSIDYAIKNLVVDTSKLEETLNKAKDIVTNKYTDETAKILSDAINKVEEALKDTTSLTVKSVNDYITTLNDAINKLVEKTITNENTNPATGDILFIIIPVLVVAILAILFTVVYSKKKKQSQTK